MAQVKTTVVGFRRYEVKNVTLGSDFPAEPVIFTSERIESIMIFSEVTLKIKFGKIINDEITIPANHHVPFPLKVRQFWAKLASGSTASEAEIVGFIE